MSPLTSTQLETALSDALARLLPGTPASLADSIRYSLLAPGKRIRPRLALAAAQVLGTPIEAALRAALALEMIHCFTLIHDDLPCMDDDDLRRGQPTNHRKFGEATALLAGDALIGLAMQTCLESAEWVGAQQVQAAIRRLAWILGPSGVAGGQALELELGGLAGPDYAPSARSPIQRADIERLHRAKTGYLFEAALLLPADLAGLTLESPQPPIVERLSVFAHQLGLSFQVMDDLEDWAQDQAERNGVNMISYFGADTTTASGAESAARETARWAWQGLERAQRELRALGESSDARASGRRFDPRALDALIGIGDEVTARLRLGTA